MANKNRALSIIRLQLPILAAVLLTIFTSAHATDCQLKQYASLDLAVLGNGFLVVPVTMQGTSVAMVLNTANALSTVSDSGADRLGLKLKAVPAGLKMRSGAKLIEKLAVVNDFSIGNARFKSADFAVVPGETLPRQAELPLVGVLGMDVLGRFDVELDVSNHKMNLFSQDHCPGRGVYWSSKYDSAPIRFGELGELYFPMQLEGKKIETTLATGSLMTNLSTDVTRKLYNFDSHSPDVEKRTDNAGGTMGYYRAMKLSGEGIQIINAHIDLTDRPANDACILETRSGAAAYEGCYGIHPLQLGLNVLTKLHLYIATKEKTLYFTSSEASK